MENNMDIPLIYQITVGKPKVSDVVSRRLVIYVNGSTTFDKTYSSDTTDFGKFEFYHNDLVEVIVTDMDDAANVSTPTVYKFVAKDIVAPPPPDVTVEFISEGYES
jgi:hypothetical protein